MIKYAPILFFFALVSSWAQEKSFEKSSEKSSMELNQTYIRENRGEFSFPGSDIEQKERDWERKAALRQMAAKHLGAIKLDLINGDLEKAKIRLLQGRHSESFTRPIQLRYLAILHFIEGDYRQSLEYLDRPEMKRLRHQDNVCLLKTLNLVILDKAADARSEWERCEGFVTGKDGGSNVWIEALLNLKVAQETETPAAPLRDLNIENERGDNLRLFLKLALYLNKQDIIFPRVPYLSVEAFENPKTRELLGLLYFRNLEIVKAYNLIEDLSTPNSENIKGNILLAQKKLELAYAQFKLALSRKSDSQNALERIVPTAWRLNQWNEGASYAARLETTKDKKDSKLALEAAFLTKDNRPEEALNKLDAIVNKQTIAQALEVNQLYSYNALILGQEGKTKERADMACGQQDAFNCWLRAHLLLWEDFPAVVKRKDKIYEDVEDLLGKFRSDFKSDPIEESVYIDQKNIEELEDAQIELIPQE